MKYILSALMISLAVGFSLTVEAHKGKLAKDGCHNKYEMIDGVKKATERHWHLKKKTDVGGVCVTVKIKTDDPSIKVSMAIDMELEVTPEPKVVEPPKLTPRQAYRLCLDSVIYTPFNEDYVHRLCNSIPLNKMKGFTECVTLHKPTPFNDRKINNLCKGTLGIR